MLTALQDMASAEISLDYTTLLIVWVELNTSAQPPRLSLKSATNSLDTGMLITKYCWRILNFHTGAWTSPSRLSLDSSDDNPSIIPYQVREKSLTFIILIDFLLFTFLQSGFAAVWQRNGNHSNLQYSTTSNLTLADVQNIVANIEIIYGSLDKYDMLHPLFIYLLLLLFSTHLSLWAISSASLLLF